MDTSFATGLLLLIAATVFLISAVVRRAERFEFAYALFFGEWAMVWLSNVLVPSGSAQIVVKLMFVGAMIMTGVMWWRLFRDFQQTKGTTGVDR